MSVTDIEYARCRHCQLPFGKFDGEPGTCACPTCADECGEPVAEEGQRCDECQRAIDEYDPTDAELDAYYNSGGGAGETSHRLAEARRLK